MYSARLNFFLAAALVVVVILLGLTASLSWQSNHQQQVAVQEVRQTYELIAQIEQLVTQSRDAYTDIRNFDLTGKAEFLQAYQAVTQQVPRQLQELEQALMNNPAELHQLHKLGDLINQRLQLGRRLLDYRNQPNKARLQEPFLARGRDILREIRPVVAGLIQRQREFVNRRQQRVEQAYQRTQQWIIVSTVAALVVIGLVFWLLRQQLLRRMGNEVRLKQYESDLQAQLRQQQTYNQELDRLNQQLARSNESLQQFAYVASHDLQEPLRKIQSFSDLLKTRFSDQLGEGVDYLNRMQSAASRMSTLIRDLLTYSRISTQRGSSDAVSLTEVVGKVLTDLELVIQETGATIKVEPLPTLPGDPTQLGQLFQNLLSNALKFRRPAIAPQITVTADPVAADHLPQGVSPAQAAAIYYRIDVSDNGIGFDEKYLDRIFQVFQRLHGKNEIAGTGIGLAICEKVAANHGGAITATSQPGQGATFSVYLPNAAGRE